jgi:hypothetical protein
MCIFYSPNKLYATDFEQFDAQVPLLLLQTQETRLFCVSFLGRKMKGPPSEKPFSTDPVRHIWQALRIGLREEDPYRGADMHG